MSAEKKLFDWIKAPNGIADYYANAAHLTWTVDDVRMRFGQYVTSDESRTPGSSDYRGVVEERAAITLSWRWAKVLRNALSEAIDDYERTNGEIIVNLSLPKSST